MAFGKDRENLSRMNLRQQMRRSTKKVTRSRGGGQPYYVNKYEPPKVGSDIIRLIPGEYPMPRIDEQARDFYRNEEGQPIFDMYPYYKYSEFRHAVKERSCIGSEGWLGNWKTTAEPCVAADWFWWEWRQRQATKSDKPKAMSKRDKWVFTVLVMAPFYKVPAMKDGQVVKNQTTGAEYFDWKKGSKRGNDEYVAAGYERKDGHVMHWSLGYGHWTTLGAFGDALGNHCRSCRAQDTIQEIALLCQECGDAVVEFESTTLSEEDLVKIRGDEVTCPHCNFHGYLDDMIRCQQCDSGERATLFDFDLEVKRVETSGEGGNQTNLQVVRAIGPKPIDSLYGEDLRKPLDLVKIFAPTPLEKQVDLFGRPPTDGEAQGPQRQPSNSGSRPYGT